MANYNQNALYEVRRAHFIERAQALWGDRFDYSDLEFTIGKEPCFITCPKHGKFRVAVAQNHIMKDPRFRTGCPWCNEENGNRIDRRLAKERKKRREAERKKREAERRRKVKERKSSLLEERKIYVAAHGYNVADMTDKQINQHYSSIKGVEKQAPLYAALKLQREQKAKERAQLRAQREQERLAERTRHFIAQAKAVHGDKYDYSSTKYEKKMHHGKMQYVLANILCPKHGYFDTRADVHTKQRCGCAKCGGNFNMATPDERKAIWVERCRKKYNDRFDYSQFHWVNNDTKGTIICREHHHAFVTDPWTHLRGSGGCPYCTGSEGEVIIRTWLENHNVHFEPQYRIPNDNPQCKRQYLQADFYLPDYNLIIEMNGKQHYQNVPHFHSNARWTFEDQQIRDETLRIYCRKCKIHLCVVKYDQLKCIPSILNAAIKMCSGAAG